MSPSVGFWCGQKAPAGPPGTCMAPGRLAGLLQVAAQAETTRDVLLALLNFTPESDGAVLTTEAVSLYFWCSVNPASLPSQLPEAGGECSKMCRDGTERRGCSLQSFVFTVSVMGKGDVRPHHRAPEIEQRCVSVVQKCKRHQSSLWVRNNTR